jgi:hypothetical protein
MTEASTIETAAEPIDGTAPREAILRRTVRMLPCRLSDVELLALGGKLADALQDVATETERQASVKKELGARLAGMQARVTELSARLRRREEEREVTVEVVANFAQNVAREIRTDTNAVLLTRELTAAERQRPLPLFEATVAENEAAATNGATPAEPPHCIECGEAVETSAAEGCTNPECPADGLLHPGCAGPHAEAHGTEHDGEDEDQDDDEQQDVGGAGGERE